MNRNLGMTAIVVACIAVSQLCAQSTVSTSGGDAKGKDGSASYTVGQTVYSYANDDRASVSEGVQQPYVFNVLAGKTVKDVDMFIAAYPNPASTTLTLKVSGVDITPYSFQLYDVKGRLILTNGLTSELTAIPMETRASGAYVLQVLKNNSIVKSFQIIKNQ